MLLQQAKSSSIVKKQINNSGGSWLNLLVGLQVIFKFFCTLCRQFICRCLAINVQIFRNSALY